jgi:glutathione S-transferase
MQAIIADRLRPPGSSDPHGVGQARASLAKSYAAMEGRIGGGWACGDFGLADCAAAPALFYADKVVPLGSEHPNLAAYLERLKARPSFARVLKEAEPYFHMYPG